MIRSLLRYLMTSAAEYQARHRHTMDCYRLRAIHRELAGVEKRYVELRRAEIEAVIDKQQSAFQLAAITNPATADNEMEHV